MAKKTAPVVSRQPGQISQDVPNYFNRVLPAFTTPTWVDQKVWRALVYNQPLCMICRETLIDGLLALDWKIEARDSDQRDELKEDIDYYTNFLECTPDGMSYEDHVTWIAQDLLDLPFGAASEMGREGDDPEGRLLWIVPLDGATLYPYPNYDWPVMQRVDGVVDTVFFPKHRINRVYMYPRREILREGWGMAAPEKIYLSMEAMSRGDRYYANLLLDTPTAGILDLGDMEKQAAEQWVESFRVLMNGIDPFKIPVLYEHENQANFLPFGKVPNDLMFDRITMRIAATLVAGYGMSLSDVGLGEAKSGGGDTLAGSIRSERRSRKTGFALLKRLMVSYFNRLLPKTLRFRFIDYDDELNVALGRARLASSTAFGAMIDKRIFTPKEARLQLIADGMITISVPEDVDEGDFDLLQVGMPKSIERPGMLGNPQPPSSGGYGESTAGVTKAALDTQFSRLVSTQVNLIAEKLEKHSPKLIRSVVPPVYQKVKEMLTTQADLVWRSEDGAPEAAEQAIEEDEPWWNIDLDDAILLSILLAAYQDEIRMVAQSIVDDLFMAGYLDTNLIDPDTVFRITNDFVLKYLREHAGSMIRNINEGTKFYIWQALVSGVRSGMTDAEIVALIESGTDVENLLQNRDIMQKLSQSVVDELRSMSSERISRIVSFELGTARSEAKLFAMRYAGMTRKHWEHFGADEPCEVCLDNISAGYVPMDFEYRSVFGTTQSGPAHPHEHCGVNYDRSELYSLHISGNLRIWTGD